MVSEIRFNSAKEIKIDLETDSNEIKLFKHIFKDLAQGLDQIEGTLAKIEIDSEIPIGSGMGSSAAFGAVISAAFFFIVLFTTG